MKEETSNYQSIKYKGVLNFETEISAAEMVLPLCFEWTGFSNKRRQSSKYKLLGRILKFYFSERLKII